MGEAEVAAGQAGTLPEGCFQPKTVSNLIMTGRAVSIAPDAWADDRADMAGAALGERAG